MSVWVPVVATLAGTLVGGLGAWAIDERRWRRQKAIRWDTARYEAYQGFLGASLRFLFRWTSFSSRSDVHKNEQHVRKLAEEVFQSLAAIDLLATDNAKRSADELATVVSDIVEYARRRYTQNRFGRWRTPAGPEYEGLLSAFAKKRAAFSKAVQEEVGIEIDTAS